MTGTFRQEISEALANPNLGGALTRFSEAYRTSRAKAYEGIDFEALRARIAEVKGDAAGRFPELVSRFREQAEKRGAKVFLADSPEKVRGYILDLAKKSLLGKAVARPDLARQVINKLRAEGAAETYRQVMGYELSQSIRVRSEKVDLVDKLSRQVTELVGGGVDFESSPPE